MRLVLRILGTWLLGLALVLAVIDGTKSLAANRLVITPLFQTWAALHEASLIGVREFLGSRLFAAMLDPVLTNILSAPGFVVFAIPGILLALVGRPKAGRHYLRQDQI